MSRVMRLFAVAVVSLGIVADRAEAVGVGDTPAWSFKSTKGETVSNETLKGKLVLIDFWATWCGPCMAEADHMVEVHNKYKDQGLQIVGISLDQSRSRLDAVVKNKKFDWPQYFDGQGWGTKFAKEWGVSGIPRTFLLSPEGTVLWVGHPAQMDRPIEQAMKQHPPKLVKPEALAAAQAALDGAQGAAATDADAALAALATLPREAEKDGAIQARLAEVRQSLEAHADAQLSRADELIAQEKLAEGVAKVQQVSLAMGDSPAGAKATAKLEAMKSDPQLKARLQAAESAQKADAELQAAKKLASEGKDQDAYVKFKSIVKLHPGSPAGAAAAEAAAAYEKDPAFVRGANEAAASGKAKGMLSVAQSLASSDRKDLARKKYQEVIDQFPGTSYAETAQRELSALK